MTETRTLQFESPRAVQSLYAHDLKLLKTLEDSLGVKVTTREGWVKLEGEPPQLDRAQRVFEQLEQARQKGVDIQKHEFNYALNSVAESRADNLNDLVDVKIVTSSRKPPIVARTFGQRNYVEAIQKNDIVFGVGPAGTGKTYNLVQTCVNRIKDASANVGIDEVLIVTFTKAAAAEWLVRDGHGEPTVTYKLRDWLFSRQRYWGEPFPIVYDEQDRPIALPDSMRPGGRIRRRIDSAVTLLPHPDSPTTPTVSPTPTLNDTPSTARATPLSALIKAART